MRPVIRGTRRLTHNQTNIPLILQKKEGKQGSGGRGEQNTKWLTNETHPARLYTLVAT